MAAKKQNCMIIGASPIESDAIFQEFSPKDSFVICADAGYETAVKYGITPDLIVGDFDSVKTLPQKSAKVLTLPVEKDVTDTMFAVMKGLTMGFRSFVLLGVWGDLGLTILWPTWRCCNFCGCTALRELSLTAQPKYSFCPTAACALPT